MPLSENLQWFLFCSAFFWAAVAVTGVPANVDEVFFLGAPVNYAKTGNFFNPNITDWMEFVHCRPDRFYAHFPFWPLAIGLWMKCFGVGYLQVLILSCLVGWIGSLGAFVLFKRLKLPTTLAWISPLLLGVLFNAQGLRPDLTAFSLALVGLCLISFPMISKRFSGFLLMGLGATAWPLTITYSIPMTLFIWFNFRIAKDCA